MKRKSYRDNALSGGGGVNGTGLLPQLAHLHSFARGMSTTEYAKKVYLA